MQELSIHCITVDPLNAYFINDIFSMPLDRLCQLAWPLISSRVARNKFEPLVVPRMIHSDVENLHLAQMIHATTSNMIDAIMSFRWGGPLTCYTLRSVLLQVSMKSMREKVSQVLPVEPIEPLLPNLDRDLIQNVKREEMQIHARNVKNSEKMQCKSPEYSAISDHIVIGDDVSCKMRENVTYLSKLLFYIAGQHDKQWMLEIVHEMVSVAALCDENGQQELISTTTHVSLHAHNNRRSAHVFLSILREILKQWNSHPVINYEANTFGFNVVLPIIYITRCTTFRDDDLPEVGELLLGVCTPLPDHSLTPSRASLSTTIPIVTKYTLKLEKRTDDALSVILQHSSPHSPLLSPSSSSSSSYPEGVRGDKEISTMSRDTVEYKCNMDTATMTTKMFFSAPHARYVCVQVHKADSCEEVQVGLVPHLTRRDNESSANNIVDAIEPKWLDVRSGATCEFSGGCDAVIHFKRLIDRVAVPYFEAEMLVEMLVAVDGRREDEFRSTLIATQLDLTASLLEKIKKPFPKGNIIKKEALMLFCNGILPHKQTRPPTPFLTALLNMDELTLQKRVPCYQRDVQGVRAALCLIAAFIGNSEPHHLSWKSSVWLGAVKRVCLASSLLGKNSTVASGMVSFVLDFVSPCSLFVSQIVESVISLLTSNITVTDLKEMLEQKCTHARLCILALTILSRLNNHSHPETMFRIVTLLREVMLYEGDHYLFRFQGCGAVLSNDIRSLVHRLLSFIFTTLQKVMSLPERELKKYDPYHFLFDTNDFAPFALLSFSLLASPLDACDVEFIWREIFHLVKILLPIFTDFRRGASFQIREEKEEGMLESLQDLLDTDGVDDCQENNNNNNSTIVDTGRTFFPVPALLGAIKLDNGMWVPSGLERNCRSCIPIHNPSPSAFVSSPFSFTSSFRAVDVQLTSAPLQALLFAFVSEPHIQLTSSIAEEDMNGFFFSPFSGKLQHAGRHIPLLPLSKGDTFSFCLSFSRKKCTCVLRLCTNGIRLAEFVTPQSPLFFVVGAVDLALLRVNSFAVRFRFQRENNNSVIRGNISNFILIGGRDDVVNSTFLSRHSVTMVSMFLFFYQVYVCAHRLLQELQTVMTRETSRRFSLKSSPESESSSASNRISTSEQTWQSFMDDSCVVLRQNIERLVHSIEHLTSLLEVENEMERAKLDVALFLYHRFLLDHIIIIRIVLRCCVLSIPLLAALDTVVCCSKIREDERCMALTTLSVVLQESHQGLLHADTYNPLQLWKCCQSLALSVSAIVYKPIFTTETSGIHFTPSCGGRCITSSLSLSTASRLVHNGICFASQGILMDGSMGDIVSFSTRLRYRDIMDGLGRRPYIGVACPNPMSTTRTLTRCPGARRDLPYTYAITDYFGDISTSSAQAELLAYSNNWISSKDNIIFASGDVITVTVDTTLRCISFERNSIPLGTPFTKISRMVKVVFPFLELFQSNSSAVFLHTPRGIGICARLAMREMLRHWNVKLNQPLLDFLGERPAVALAVLGADGDERLFSYTSPALRVVGDSEVVQFVQQVHNMAEVILCSSKKKITVPMAVLEPKYDSIISDGVPSVLLVDNLMHIVFTSLEFITNKEGKTSVRISHLKQFIKALRLLYEMNPIQMSMKHVEKHQKLLEKVIALLALPGSIPSNTTEIIMEAWNVMLLFPDDEIFSIVLSHDDMNHKFIEGVTTPTSGNVREMVDENNTLSFLCPGCNKEWSSCLDDGHVAPSSLCVTLHYLLHHLHLPSPFTGFACDWSLPEKHVHITLRVSAKGEVEGEGEDPRGVFTFSGKLISSHRIQGRCVYKTAECLPPCVVKEGDWACEECTFINPPDSTRCAICRTAHRGATWKCATCGYVFNSNKNLLCDTCGRQRLGATPDDGDSGKMRSFCESCGAQRDYFSFVHYECRKFCDTCQSETRWLSENKNTAVVEARIVGKGDEMEWVTIFGNVKCIYSNLRTNAYSTEEMLQLVKAKSSMTDKLSQYIPPLLNFKMSVMDKSSATLLQESKKNERAILSVIHLFCNRIVCCWCPNLLPQSFTESRVLRHLQVMDESWLLCLANSAESVMLDIFCACLRILFTDNNNEKNILSLSFIARVVMKKCTHLHRLQNYYLYALCVNAIRSSDTREIREACYASLNNLLEDTFEEFLKTQCLKDVVTITPVVAGQRQLMVYASLRGVDVSVLPIVTSTTWLLEAVLRMEHQRPLRALFDNETSIFPYLAELPNTHIGDSGELMFGQVRGSVGVQAVKGGRYYYEVLLPPDFSERSLVTVMGWGTMRHELHNSGQHVGTDFCSWGFNCQDRLRMLTGEQALAIPQPIVGGDVIGALLDLDSMMMCWSINGHELMWISISTQGVGEAIYPFVSAVAEPHGVVVRLDNTQFKPAGYEDFSPILHEGAMLESTVLPQSYEFYVQLCRFGNDIVNCGFTFDSILTTNVWFDRARHLISQYPLLNTEVDGALVRLRPYFLHLRSINALAVSGTKNEDIFSNSPKLMTIYQKSRELLFFAARWSIVERCISRRLTRSAANCQHEVLIDLKKAKILWQVEDSASFTTRFDASVSGQLFRKTKDANIYCSAVMFVISLADEVADDAGGVTRSVVTMMCDELNYRDGDDACRLEPLLPFFRLTEHSTMVSVVPNIEFYRENMEYRELFLQFFTWIGKLLGNAALSGYLMFSLTFSRLVWKFLTFDELSIDDYYVDIEDSVRRAVESDEFLLNDDLFYTIPGIEREEYLASGTMSRNSSTHFICPMTPSWSLQDLSNITAVEEHGPRAKVEKRRKKVESALIHQFDVLLVAMRSGISSVIPPNSLRLIRWDDLQQRVCGTPDATAENVLSVLNLSLLSDELSLMLVKVVTEWSTSQRSQFLLFCSGQRRIPLPEQIQVLCGDDVSALPTAHTCSPISLLLHPYSSAFILREKLEICLRHMYEFGFV